MQDKKDQLDICDSAQKVIEELIYDTDISANVRLSAANTLMDRIQGKSALKPNRPIKELSNTELKEIMAWAKAEYDKAKKSSKTKSR